MKSWQGETPLVPNCSLFIADSKAAHMTAAAEDFQKIGHRRLLPLLIRVSTDGAESECREHTFAISFQACSTESNLCGPQDLENEVENYLLIFLIEQGKACLYMDSLEDGIATAIESYHSRWGHQASDDERATSPKHAEPSIDDQSVSIALQNSSKG